MYVKVHKLFLYFNNNLCRERDLNASLMAKKDIFPLNIKQTRFNIIYNHIKTDSFSDLF